MTPPNLLGVHHVSALSADIARNRDFYTGVLGLRLVKTSVNQDSPSMYHLFYADGAGTPGSDMTFFDFPRAAREHRGQHSVTLTTFRVTGPQALTYWAQRLSDLGVAHSGIQEVGGRASLHFEDVDSTRLALFDDGGQGPRGVPNPHSDVPSAFQIQGLGYSGYVVADLSDVRDFLERGLGLRESGHYGQSGQTTHIFAVGAGGPHAELHFTVHPGLPRHRPGAGGVHHVALRVADRAELDRWLTYLNRQGVRHSGHVDRHYFESIYLNEPGGLIVELATDGPGFATDEPLDTLGERLALPPFLEPRRAQIEAELRPLPPGPTPPTLTGDPR